MNLDVIWQIAGIGILVVVIHQVFKTAGRDELAWLVTLVGVVVVMWQVVQVVSNLFQSVRTTFGI